MKRIEVLGHTSAGFHKISCCAWPSWIDSRTPVVCVHGLFRNARDFDKLAAELSQTRSVYCPDMAGRGFSDDLSDPNNYTIPQYIDDMTAVFAATGAREVDWVGTSMGGLMGMVIAAQPQNPIRKLVLNDVGPMIYAPSVSAIDKNKQTTPNAFKNEQEIETYLRKAYAGWGDLTDEDWALMASYGKRVRPDGSLTLAYDPAISIPLATIQSDINLWETYDRIKCPVLVLRGANSKLLTAEVAQEMTQRGPRAQCVEIEGCAHAPSLMTKEQIRLVADFIKG